jgi:hypothetical protein
MDDIYTIIASYLYLGLPRSKQYTNLNRPFKFVRDYKLFEEDTDYTLKHLPNLTRLDCGDNTSFTDEGLKYLPHLTWLDYENNTSFTDEGLKYLPHLTKLDCGENKNLQTKD